MVRLIVVTLPLAWLLSGLDNAQYIIWPAFPSAEAVGLVVALVFFRRVMETQAAMIEKGQADDAVLTQEALSVTE